MVVNGTNAAQNGSMGQAREDGNTLTRVSI